MPVKTLLKTVLPVAAAVTVCNQAYAHSKDDSSPFMGASRRGSNPVPQYRPLRLTSKDDMALNIREHTMEFKPKIVTLAPKDTKINRIIVHGAVHGDEKPGAKVVDLLQAVLQIIEVLPSEEDLNSVINNALKDSYKPELIKKATKIVTTLRQHNKDMLFKIMNELARNNNHRYEEKDLNRSAGSMGERYATWPEKVSNSDTTAKTKIMTYESMLLSSLVKNIGFKEDSFGADLHTTTSHTEAIIVVSGGNQNYNMAMAMKIGRDNNIRVLLIEDQNPSAILACFSPQGVAFELGPVTRNENNEAAESRMLDLLLSSVEAVTKPETLGGIQTGEYFAMKNSVSIPPGYKMNELLKGSDFREVGPKTVAFINMEDPGDVRRFEKVDGFSPGRTIVFVDEKSYSPEVNRGKGSTEELLNKAFFFAEKRQYNP
jgi:succinylglutamate desuccinylase